MASSVYAISMVDVLDVTQLGLDLTSTLNKAALFTNALVPNFLTDTDFTLAPYTTNQVSSANYTAGGIAIATPTWVAAGASPVITYNLANLVWNSVTFTARWAIFYADGLAGNNLYYACDFGADFTVTNNNFTVDFATNAGLFTWTL